VRDYLYLWHDVAAKRLIASGIHVADVTALLAGRGVFVFRDEREGGDDWDGAEAQGLPFATEAELPALAACARDWGDLKWVDFASPEPPTLEPEALAELLYYRHTGAPLRAVGIPGLGNRFLGHGHDDGWFLGVRYVDWADVERWLRPLVRPLVPASEAVLEALGAGTSAFWIRGGTVEIEEPTTDLDRLLNRRFPPPP